MRYVEKPQSPPKRPPSKRREYLERLQKRNETQLAHYVVDIKTSAGNIVAKNIQYREILPAELPREINISEDSVTIRFMATRNEFLSIQEKLKERGIIVEVLKG